MADGKIQVGASGEYLNTNEVTTSVGTVHNEVIDQGNITSSNNSRDAATLAATAVFQGVGEDVSRYGRAGISITSDNATDGTLTIEVSHDNVNWGGPNRTWSDTRFAEPHMWNIVEKYFRIKYTNGTTEATNLSIQVQYSNNSDILLGHQLNQTFLDETEALATRSVLVAKDDTGNYVNIGAVTQDGRSSIYTVDGFSNTFSVHIDFTVTPNSTDIGYMLVDLSDTTNWPHTHTGEIVLEYIVIEIDPPNNFTGNFKIGYLKNVDATNGDMVVLFGVDMATKSDLLNENIEFGSHGIHCTDGNHFGPTMANNTVFQTDVNLGGPDDPSTLTYPSGDGDLVLYVTGNNHAVDVSITLGYETSA